MCILLGFDIEFQGFSHELSTLPGEYVPPFGCILPAENSDRFVGCVALRRLDESACEMKRLFVIPEYRDTSIGRKLANAVIEEAGRSGYFQMRLDTVASMREANALYVSIGFRISL
ncbi:MAG: GNAT family N-acetyltransferase [Desulfobacteraceae bacterium]|nr:GNAT family N-acetyltransferase [Desulfobacteraceae bacterium]